MNELVLAERVRHLSVKDDPAATLRSITELALETTVSDHASVTLIEPDGTLTTSASTDETAVRADALQYELGEGPCVTAAERGELYVIGEMEQEPRWPAWCREVVEHTPIRSALSIHLFTADRALGALNLYSDQLRSWSEEEVVACRIVAAHASVALARLRHEQDLWRAVDARHLIGLAQGMLMERYSINAEQSFSVLRRFSQSHNIKLASVARTLVDGGELPGELPRDPHPEG